MKEVTNLEAEEEEEEDNQSDRESDPEEAAKNSKIEAWIFTQTTKLTNFKWIQKCSGTMDSMEEIQDGVSSNVLHFASTERPPKSKRLDRLYWSHGPH